MNVKKSQRAFVGVTLTTVLGIALVLIVYAAVIGTRYGGEVTVTPTGGVGGTIYYSKLKTGSWTETLSVDPVGTAWYAELVTPTTQSYTGPVEITWELWKKGSATDWTDATSRGTQTTLIVLTTGQQTIYVEPAGTDSALNFNWASTGYGDIEGSYRVVATIESS